MDLKRSKAYFKINQKFTLKGQWAVNTNYYGKRDTGEIYDIILCSNNKEIAFMPFIKQSDNTLGFQNLIVRHCAQCDDIKDKLWVENHRTNIKNWILSFLKTLQ